MKLGQTMDSAEYRYLKRVAQIGLSKDVLSMAKFNLNQYLPIDRNTIAVDANTTVKSTPAFSKLTPVSVPWRGWILQEPPFVGARLFRHRNMI